MNIRKRVIMKWDRYFWNLRQNFKKYLTKKKYLGKDKLTAIIENLDEEYSQIVGEKKELWNEIKKNYTG